MEQQSISVKFPGEGGSLVLGVSGYEKPDLAEGPGANWLHGSVTVTAGAFHGSFPASFTTYELHDFRAGLHHALTNSCGSVTFETTDADLSLRVELPESGAATITGVAMPSVLHHGYLTFRLGADRETLKETLEQLDQLLQCCPVRDSDY